MADIEQKNETEESAVAEEAGVEDTGAAEETAGTESAATETAATAEASAADEPAAAAEAAGETEVASAAEAADAEPVAAEETAEGEPAAEAAAEDAAAETPAADETPAAEEAAAAPAVEYTYDELKGKTVVQMREIAEGLGEHDALHGYTTMHKEELLVALCAALGIEAHEHHVVVGIDKAAVKVKIRELKEQRAALIEAKDARQLKIVRRRIRSLKRKIHKATV